MFEPNDKAAAEGTLHELQEAGLAPSRSADGLTITAPFNS